MTRCTGLERAARDKMNNHAENRTWPLVVKNGFSHLTKEQEGQDRPRKDIMNRHQVKALREGCHERKEAWMGVSSREKMNTNKNLARATTKSKSEMQTVSNGCVSRGGRDEGFEERPNVRDLIE